MENLAEELRNLKYYTDIDYCEDRKHWYWEDYKNDTYRQGFESEEEARKDLEEYLADKTNKKI